LRLGKSAEAVIDYLVDVAGGSATIEEIADFMHSARPWELKRRVINRLAERGIVTLSGDTISLVADWLEALNQEREVSGEISAYKRDFEKFNRERTGYRDRHQNKPERAASHEEMREHRESYPLRRREAISQALARLFEERPEYRGRRPGQVACMLPWYLPADFPRGPDGPPKDREVENILDGAAA
jgi:hypothetical protein